MGNTSRLVKAMGRPLKEEPHAHDGDVAKVLWTAGVLMYLALAGYAVIAAGKDFDMQAFGIGLASVLAGGGAGVGVKKWLQNKGGAPQDRRPQPGQ